MKTVCHDRMSTPEGKRPERRLRDGAHGREPEKYPTPGLGRGVRRLGSAALFWRILSAAAAECGEDRIIRLCAAWEVQHVN